MFKSNIKLDLHWFHSWLDLKLQSKGRKRWAQGRRKEFQGSWSPPTHPSPPASKQNNQLHHLLIWGQTSSALLVGPWDVRVVKRGGSEGRAGSPSAAHPSLLLPDPPAAFHCRSRGKAFNTHASPWRVRPRSSAFHTSAANEVSKFQSKVRGATGRGPTPRRRDRVVERRQHCCSNHFWHKPAEQCAVVWLWEYTQKNEASF